MAPRAPKTAPVAEPASAPDVPPRARRNWHAINDAITGMRALAFLSVVCVHMWQPPFWHMPPEVDVARWRRFVSEHWVVGRLLNNGDMGVDVFFVLSGLLLVQSLAKQPNEPLWKVAVRRYMRLMPALFGAMMLHLLYFKYVRETTDGDFLIQHCKHDGWRNLLFINNWWDMRDSCLCHTWSLAVDFQLFLLSLPLVALVVRGTLTPRTGILVALVGVLASLGLRAHLFHHHGLNAPGGPFKAMGDLTYSKTHTRGGTYLLGVLLGFVEFAMDASESTERAVLRATRPLVGATGQLVALLAMLGAALSGIFVEMFQGMPYPYSPEVGLAIMTLRRTVFAAAVAWLVFCSNRGVDTLVLRALRWQWWRPLANLTYAGYLMQFVAIDGALSTLDERWFGVDLLGFAWRYVLVVAMATAAALPLHDYVELPLSVDGIKQMYAFVRTGGANGGRLERRRRRDSDE